MIQLLAALVPVTIFYAIYSRYFLFRPEIIKHVEAFLGGIFLALLILVAPNYIPLYMNIQDPVLIALLKAAIPEKLGALVLLIILQRHYPNFSIMEGTISAMIFGIGFAIVENFAYAVNFGISVIIIRLIFSVPLHMTTCGIMGYYLGLRKSSTTKMARSGAVAKALFLPFFIHWAFDAILLIRYPASLFAAPLLILTVLSLEFMLARGQIVAPLDILKAMSLRLEDWLTIDRQPKYERWIMQSMGLPESTPLSIFAWRPGLYRLSAVVILIACALAGVAFRAEICEFLNLTITRDEQFILLGMYPSTIAVILILVGAINPNFMKSGKIKIPVIADADVYRNGAFYESLVTYDFSLSSCFLRTSDPYGIGDEFEIEIQFKKWRSPRLTAKVVWENHSMMGEDYPVGSVAELETKSTQDFKKFFRFFIRYSLFRISRGIAFNLQLPGFEITRKYFMRPQTTMQTIRLYRAGEEIFKEGDSGTEFYLLKKGRILFYKKKESGEVITMDTISDGELFGEMAIMGKNSRAATAKCLTDCVVAVADIANLNALIYSNPDFSLSLIRKLVERLQTSEQVLIENIKKLEREKRDSEKYYHAALVLTLIGLGYFPQDGKFKLDIDLKKINEVVKNLDDDSLQKIIDIIILKQKNFETSEMDDKTAEMIKTLYEQFNLHASIKQ